MSKELEALERIKREAGIPYFSSLYDIDMWREDFAIIEKSLKALEIIKKKRVDVDLFKRCNDYFDYERNILYWHGESLTEEEYDLLKKVLL